MRSLIRHARARLVNKLNHNRAFRRAKWLVLQRTEPLRTVEIETNARCNRACAYCPVSTSPKRVGQMSEELYQKIIADLAEMGFHGSLSYHFYNEPLLDKRLERFVAHARSRLPRARLKVFSNGDPLSAKRAQALFEGGLDESRISLHDAEVKPRIENIKRELPAHFARRITDARYYEQPEALDNRGGLVDRADASIPDRSAGCDSSEILTIAYTGQVALCCNDYFVDNSHGDLNHVSVRELWQRSAPLRQRLFIGEYELPICRVCTGLAPERLSTLRTDALSRVRAPSDAAPDEPARD